LFLSAASFFLAQGFRSHLMKAAVRTGGGGWNLGNPKIMEGFIMKHASKSPLSRVTAATGSRGRAARKRSSQPPGPSLPTAPDPNSTSLASPGGGSTERAVDVAALPDGSLVELIEDPNNPNRTLFAISKNGRVRFADQIQAREETLVPVPRSDPALEAVKLPNGVCGYGSLTRLVYTLTNFIRLAVDMPPGYYFLLSSFVLYTWLADRLQTAVYLSIVGLPQSGKTTLLELLNLLCRRALLVNDISPAAVYRACSKFSVTLLIDEIDWQSSAASQLRHSLRAGTSPGSRAVHLRQSATSFGPKVLCSLQASPDPALNSRCIEIAMAETGNRELRKPDDPGMMSMAAICRRQLLKLRFNRHGSIRPAVIPGLEVLRPRSRDLFGSLAAPILRCPPVGQILLGHLHRYQDPVTGESLSSRQAALLAVLFRVIHQPSPISSVGIKWLTDAANTLLRTRGERVTLTNKATGTSLTSLGLRERQRTNHGWILWLDSATVERIHQLVRTQDNEFILTREVEGCSICRPASSNSAVRQVGDRPLHAGERRERRER
jgi:hypothetical protein